LEQEITIKISNTKVNSQMDISYLRDVEISIIHNMYRSKELFYHITNQLKAEDFTFVVNREIFKYLIFLEKEDDYFGNDSKKIEIAMNIADIYNITPIAILKILGGKTEHYESINNFEDDKKENNLDADIFEILYFSKNRQEHISKESSKEIYYSNIVIEDEYGFYNMIFCNGIIKEIKTTYIFHLPKELCDTFEYTFENLIPYMNTDNNELKLITNQDDSEDIQAFSLKKNIKKIEQIERLIQWADKNKIDNIKLPNNRGSLLEYSMIGEFNKCNLDNIPIELFKIKKNTFAFNFIDNKIKSVPSNISISKCRILMLCNNEISIFPKSVYELSELTTLCLHGNKIKILPDDIDELKKLTHLSISNNPIEKLPSNISKITTLTDLDIENTFIDEDSLKFLNLEKIEKICFNDRLLPYFIKNLHKLKNIDTINLVYSKYKKDNQTIPSGSF